MGIVRFFFLFKNGTPTISVIFWKLIVLWYESYMWNTFWIQISLFGSFRVSLAEFLTMFLPSTDHTGYDSRARDVILVFLSHFPISISHTYTFTKISTDLTLRGDIILLFERFPRQFVFFLCSLSCVCALEFFRIIKRSANSETVKISKLNGIILIS